MSRHSNGNIAIQYPRKILIRRLLKFLGRLILNLFFSVEVSGRENFPNKGPLIVVGNHTAIMESVLLMVFTPWPIEMLGAADIPHEKFNQLISKLFGYIPVNRGHVDRFALKATLSVLNQKGIIGIFPEGGIWEPGVMRTQTGVAWISYHSNTPVLPICFIGSFGAINKALNFKRPTLTMKVGSQIPALKPDPSVARKNSFEIFSEHVMSQIRNLVLPGDPSIQGNIKDEAFELVVRLQDEMGNQKKIPLDLVIIHEVNLAKFFHRPAILKIFRSNLKLPIDVLESLDQNTNPLSISTALNYVINYIHNINPFILTYRFGPKIAEEMLLGLKELHSLSRWAVTQSYSLEITPIRRFYSLGEGKEIVQINQKAFEKWM